MFKARLVLMIALAAFVMAPVQAQLIELDMTDIFARPWGDNADGPVDGVGWMSQGPGHMKIDFGVTYDGLGVPPYNQPHPDSGWDYLGNDVGGPGFPGGAFDEDDNYLGSYTRLPTTFFTLADSGGVPLTTSDVFSFCVYKTIEGGPEHVRELQLYDSTGSRNTYEVQAEATAHLTPQGWKEYLVPLSSPLENNADLTDIVEITLWVSAWSAYVSGPGSPPVWPDDYTIVRPTGTPVLIGCCEIPEPATVCLLGFGGLLLRRRKRA